MKKVPNSSHGASRRAYNHAYSKSSTDRVHDTLKGMKLSTPAMRTKRTSSGGRKPVDYNKEAGDGLNISFGSTGLGKDDYYG